MTMKTAASLRVVGLSRGLLLAALGSTIAISAQAGTMAIGDDEQTVQVSYAGLDLRDPAARQTLYGRLKVAARIACGGDISGVREVQRIFAHKACATEALETAVQSIDNAALTALHSQSKLEAPVI
jgi:UrcA family protein